MAIFNLNVHPSISCWKITEDEEELNHLVNLSDWEVEHIKKHKRKERRKELLVARILSQKVIPKSHIHYKNKRPVFTNSDSEISISNTKNFVAIQIQEKEKPTGIDIQYLSETVKRVKHKFLHSIEKELFDIDNLLTLNVIWSAKETLYKAYSEDKLEFKKQLIITEINEKTNEIAGEILFEKNERKTFVLGYHQKEQFVLTYFKS